MGFNDEIIQGLSEALSFEKKEITAKKMKCKVNPVPEYTSDEIKKIRANLKMTQNSFASVMGVNKKTIEAWESGRNKPMGAARRLLQIYCNDKETIKRNGIIL